MALRWAAFRDKFRVSTFGRNVAVLAGGAMLSQALYVAITPLLTRLYSPEHFGVWSVFAALIAVLAVPLCLRYDWAIPLPKEDGEAADLFAFSMAAAFALCAMLALAMVLWGDRLFALHPNLALLAPYRWLFLVGALAGAIDSSATAWAVRRRRYQAMARATVAQNVGAGVLQIGLGVLGFLNTGLLSGETFRQFAHTVVSLAGDGRDLLRYWRALTIFRLRCAALRYARFSAASIGASLANIIGINALPLAATILYGAAEAGWLALGMRIVATPAGLISNATMNVLWGEASNLVHSDPARYRLLFHDTARKLVWAGAGIGVLGLISPLLAVFVFGGENWRMAGWAALILGPGMAASFVGALSQLNVLRLQRWNLAWTVGRLLGVLAGFALCAWLRAPFLVFVGVYCVVLALTYGVLYRLNVVGIDQICARHFVREQPAAATT